MADHGRLRERVEAFREAAGRLVAGPTDLFAGDAVEKGQSAPDRRVDLSGEPIFLAMTRLADGFDASSGASLRAAQEQLGRSARKEETWLLREQFERRSDRAVPSPQADWLQIVLMNVDPAVDGEFNDWYEQEHVARIAAVAPEFVSVQRLEAIAGSPRYFALWRLTDRKAPERDPWLSASETPWTTRIRRFMRDRRRLLLAPYVD